jgi:uncharacterized protein (TIGR03086 family)
MSVDRLEQAFADTREILAAVRPEDHGKATPCASWTVRDVANHVAEGANWFGLCVNGRAAPDPDPTHGVDFAAGDLMASYDEGVARTLDAFRSPGALEDLIALPFGELPGAIFLNIATDDVFVHGWDLARATGQDVAFDETMAAGLLADVQLIVADEMRGPDGSEAPFGPRVEAPAGASPVEQLVSFLGRAV